jgi:hypothetical protein
MVDTQSHDIARLMEAVGSLRAMYGQIYLLLAALLGRLVALGPPSTSISGVDGPGATPPGAGPQACRPGPHTRRHAQRKEGAASETPRAGLGARAATIARGAGPRGRPECYG